MYRRETARADARTCIDALHQSKVLSLTYPYPFEKNPNNKVCPYISDSIARVFDFIAPLSFYCPVPPCPVHVFKLFVYSEFVLRRRLLSVFCLALK